jgi:hypothetical protein
MTIYTSVKIPFIDAKISFKTNNNDIHHSQHLKLHADMRSRRTPRLAYFLRVYYIYKNEGYVSSSNKALKSISEFKLQAVFVQKLRHSKNYCQTIHLICIRIRVPLLLCFNKIVSTYDIFELCQTIRPRLNIMPSNVNEKKTLYTIYLFIFMYVYMYNVRSQNYVV